jgi:hypothetical protein
MAVLGGHGGDVPPADLRVYAIDRDVIDEWNVRSLRQPVGPPVPATKVFDRHSCPVIGDVEQHVVRAEVDIGIGSEEHDVIL